MPRTTALTAGVKDVRPGDEAIVPAQTFVATWLAATHVGLKPVAVDVDPQTGTLSESAVRLAVTPRTRAIVPVHLFGFAAPSAAVVGLVMVFGKNIAQMFGATTKSLGGEAGVEAAVDQRQKQIEKTVEDVDKQLENASKIRGEKQGDGGGEKKSE